MRIAILTISDAGARGERTSDGSGDAIAAWVKERHGAGGTESGGTGGLIAGTDTIVARALVADDATAITAQLAAWCDGDVADLLTHLSYEPF